jgi:ABC-type nitrate/sulfonate/bicarbonate transport system permease component
MGVGTWPQFILIAGYTLVTIQVNAFTAVVNLSPESQNFARTLGASGWRLIRTTILPPILPELLGGVRVTLQLAWGLAVVAELLGAKKGIGEMMAIMNQVFQTNYIIAGILWIAVVAVVSDWLLRLLFIRVTRWSPGAA